MVSVCRMEGGERSGESSSQSLETFDLCPVSYRRTRGDLAREALQVLEVEGDREGDAATADEQDRLQLLTRIELSRR